ncbi:uncharacterized protein B0I36DRAFT_352521 [Microdochium trichocladiopsis]|uniref:Uncharacterized protein n=1 Tax=Microdochium trichocladiopsis TaxID=1682393 RepID=A0A9P8Y3V1_9PEZI|nr:uncharacterized protein B0I36DRAFT_352521 [Microdochium trichocladiopsis]KAH7026692.1 hypothetical protein B0I36DRAFT_352521 [Microdochium trichocladiopsis]
MKASLATSLAALVGIASAFQGQVDYRVSTGSEGNNPQLHIRDYNTGSTYYSGALYLNPDEWRNTYMTGSGGYNFPARAKKTSTNCIHVDFQGALDAGWYYCCGGVPCDLRPH